MTIFVSVVLLALALFMLGLQRAYQYVPLKELRRRAQKGDELAKALYRAASYGYSLRILLAALSIASSALLYFYVAHITEPWLAVFLLIMLLWFMYIWLPAQAVHQAMMRAAAIVTPAVTGTLQYLHPLFDRLVRFIRRHRTLHVHSGMYEVEDIVELLEHQAGQPDNRIPESTIHVAVSALTFAQKPIRDIYTPRRVVRSISADETVGPVLMSELHESGFSRFPVYEEKQDNIVGILHLRDLVDKRHSGKIRSYMQKKVCFIHEDQTLRNGLDAILKTHQQLYVVVNSFEEYVGIVSIEDILEQVLGEQIVDEFDAYEDMRSVAASQAKKDRKKHNHPANTPEDSSEVVE